MTPNADRAIKILKKVQQACGNALLAYWVLPNIILTLSGARAYCDSVFWEYDQAPLEDWDTEIKRSLEVVRNTVSITDSAAGIQSGHDNERYASMELLLDDGLQYVLNQTSLLDKREFRFSDSATTEDVSSELVTHLREQPQFKDYNDENLNHVTFGIMLGYPDIAISESVLLWEKDDPFMEPLIDADIRGSGYYICPRPVYSYPRHLISNPTITANEQLWSQILKDYYTSAFHKHLESEPEFMNKMEELKNLR